MTMNDTPSFPDSPAGKLTADPVVLRRYGQNRHVQMLIALVLDRRFIPVCFAVYTLLRLALVMLIPVTPSSDGAWYFESAMDLAAGLGYTEHGVPTAFWPPGYPLFLSLVFRIFGPYLLAAQMANVVLSCIIFLVSLVLARRIFNSEL